MNLHDTLREALRSAQSGILVETAEPADVRETLRRISLPYVGREEDKEVWSFAYWNAADGLTPKPAEPVRRGPGQQSRDIGPEPLATALQALLATARQQAEAQRAAEQLELPSARETALAQLARRQELLVVEGALRQLTGGHLCHSGSDPYLTQLMVNLGRIGKATGCFLILLEPVGARLPQELADQFLIVRHPLPDAPELRQILRDCLTDDVVKASADPEEDVRRTAEAALGLTVAQAEVAFCRSMFRTRRLDPRVVWDIKADVINSQGLLEVTSGTSGFESLGGLEGLKEFARQALPAGGRSDPKTRAKGLVLLGVPGTGKSAFAKALGHETGRPTLFLDVGRLMNSLVGETESLTRRALQIVDSMAPCVLFVDEVEKALGGAGTDTSGVTTRLFGAFLTWLNDHESDVFVTVTSNDVTKTPPEFLRAERFDGVFFFDLPSEAQRRQVWDIYLRHFGLPEQELPDDYNWTGAEIRGCCRLAAQFGRPLTEASRYVIPIADTADDSIRRLRTWANGRCLDAETGTVFHETEPVPQHTNSDATAVVRRRPASG